MNWFDLLLTQPIFNLLSFLYNFIGDFGVAIIILTIIVRIILWPLVKKQLHQTKLMRAIQPELKKIKRKAAGNRMLESQMMMELYREKGVKPFGSILVLAIQLPIFIAVFNVIQLFNLSLPATTDKNYEQAVSINQQRQQRLQNLAYPVIADFSRVKSMTSNPENFKPKLFGLIDLTRTAGDYLPAMILALMAAFFQFYQSKQIMPQSDKKRRLRDMFKEAAAGKEVDQTEMAAATTGKMIYLFPVITFMIAMVLPAAVVLYYATTSLVAVVQQHFVLKKDQSELETMARQPVKKASSRQNNAIEAEIITRKASKNKQSPEKSSRTTSGQTVVRRIKAK
jgi:YidC/Oxa1 family membrane protein insertase